MPATCSRLHTAHCTPTACPPARFPARPLRSGCERIGVAGPAGRGVRLAVWMRGRAAGAAATPG
eukprot:347635-Chlamydomonas_euryale.AAC.1